MVKILHGADFHLDAPFSALPHGLATGRREELRALPQRMCDLAEDLGAQLLLLSGDLFDGEETCTETIEVLARALGRFPGKVFIAPGNHDFYTGKSPYTSPFWPDNVHIFKTEEVTSIPMPELGCVVHGAAFTSPSREDSPLSGFTAPRDGQIHLMVLHGDVGGGGNYGSITPAEIAATGLHYLALGHIHGYGGVQKAGDVSWAYPGCPEGRGFDETGEKGVLAGTVGEETHLTFHPLSSRRYEIITVDVTDKDPTQAVLDMLPPERSPHIVRILLTGETGVTGLNLSALESLCAPKFFNVSLRDRTKVRRDLWDRAGENTLTGLFLEKMAERLTAGGDEEEITLAIRFALSALERGEDCCP